MSLSLVLSSFFAGVLTIFSPCILPMVPFVVRSSFQKSKWGPVLLALGVALSFSISTFIIATSGQLLGLTPDNLKILSGIFLLLASLLFLFPVLIDKISLALSPINNKIQTLTNNKETESQPVYMEFINGLFLGPIWAPCSGPTLAIIIGIIINNPETKSSIVLLAIFSIGSILPILFFSYGAKSLVMKIQKKSLDNSKYTKLGLGLFCGVMSILILTGLDKSLETAILNILPEALTNISLTI
ncbi:cytochrome c biogenesis CcdA family protein [Halobacteriovorax sp.]|uniref:cytochrome c biogenesis CcdA family protein n=1 Tax=Halobacteriovorax sp. TaxID=2020862 RepID=UPI003568EE4E